MSPEPADRVAPERRSPARAGIAALNLLAPGLGLIRTGSLRQGLGFFAAQLALIAAITLSMAFYPIRSHISAVAALAVVGLLWLALILGSVILTWRSSARLRRPRVWSRWYSLVGIFAAMTILLSFTVDAAHGFYRPFYLPTKSMLPTIGENDRIVAQMNWRGPFRRGQIVMFRHRDEDWIKRIAALPGDRFAMRNGVPIINGVAAYRVRVSSMEYDTDRVTEMAFVSNERFPGEAGAHEVLDTAQTPYDNTAEIVVPPDHLFLLGDNRDHSADSRVPEVEMGTGPVPITAVTGRASFISWGIDHSRTGRRLNN